MAQLPSRAAVTAQAIFLLADLPTRHFARVSVDAVPAGGRRMPSMRVAHLARPWFVCACLLAVLFVVLFPVIKSHYQKQTIPGSAAPSAYKIDPSNGPSVPVNNNIAEVQQPMTPISGEVDADLANTPTVGDANPSEPTALPQESVTQASAMQSGDLDPMPSPMPPSP